MKIVMQRVLQTVGFIMSKMITIYHKIPIISPGLIFAGLIFGGTYVRRGLLLEGIFRFKMGWT